MVSQDDASLLLRKVEKRIALFGLIFILDPLIALSMEETPHYAFIIGYFIGFASFAIFCETYLVTKNNPAVMALIIFLANLKLIIIGLCIWGLHTLGLSAVESIIGVFASQIIMTLFMLLNNYTKKQAQKDQTN